MKDKKGFTIIELLIVIGMISILTAIVLPNLMSANIRTKVKGIRTEMGSIAITLEDYRVDNEKGEYPIQSQNSGLNADEIGSSGAPLSASSVAGLGKLIYPTTSSISPVYLSNIPGDPFNDDGKEDSGAHNNHYSYFTGQWSGGTRVNSTTEASYWALVSYGPDKDQDITSYIEAWKAVDVNAPDYNPAKAYDSDNGITSSGDIIIIGP